MHDQRRADRRSGRPPSKPAVRRSGLLVASNRLPLELERRGDGSWSHRPGSGGLVTALDPVLHREGGMWVGWPGVAREDGDGVEEAFQEGLGPDGYDVEPVLLTRDEQRGFYLGFANQVLWPLCHGFPGRCRYDPTFWDAYGSANRRYARKIARVCGTDRFIWVHDYHLMLVGGELRRQGCDNRVGYFHHIPFPPLDLFEQLPWSRPILRALLHFDLVGFQRSRDRRNFLACAETLVDGCAVVDEDVVRGPTGRDVRVGSFPISIDWEEFDGGAASDPVVRRTEHIREGLEAETLVLGVDRLDYSKGLPEKLRGFERALEKHPDLRGAVTLLQLVVPSREGIPEYEDLRTEVEQTVGRINGLYGEGSWTPVLYRFGSWERELLLAVYRAADVALVTSLRDGMNLVSKEFVAASGDGRGVLVLSPFAGSIEELEGGALTANPHDIEALADAIFRACRLPEDERKERLKLLRSRVRSWDVHAWVRSFLGAGVFGPEGNNEDDKAGWRARARRTWSGTAPDRRFPSPPPRWAARG